MIGAKSEKLFQEESPIGKIFRINDTPFKVVGVLKEKGSAGGGQSQDDVVFVPLATAQSRVIGPTRAAAGKSVDFITVKASDSSLVASVQVLISDLLRQRGTRRPSRAVVHRLDLRLLQQRPAVVGHVGDRGNFASFQVLDSLSEKSASAQFTIGVVSEMACIDTPCSSISTSRCFMSMNLVGNGPILPAGAPT